MNFLKANWLRLVVLVLLVCIVVIVFLFYLDHRPHEKISSGAVQLVRSTTTEEVRVDTAADDYVVTHDKDGNPITWKTIDRSWVILDDTLSTYENGSAEIKKSQEKERDSLAHAYGTLAEISDPATRNTLRQLISLEEQYIDSGEKLVMLIDSLITDYKDLKKVTEKRDSEMYLYYSQEIDKLELQKKAVLTDYVNKQNAKQNYAKAMLSQ